MNEIASADALRAQAIIHEVAYGRWENGVQLALLQRNAVGAVPTECRLVVGALAV